MITSNVISRVFFLEYRDSKGTCFSIDVDGRQYFVTARHVVEGLTARQTISLWYKEAWSEYQVKFAWHCKGQIDISVFVLNLKNYAGKVVVASDGLMYGQDVYFLGYPFGFKSEVGPMNRGLPMPFVKKGIVSALHGRLPGNEILWIDGHNNPGFSGGPVVIADRELNFQIVGVISSYTSYLQNLSIKDTIVPDAFVSLNSGLINAYPIEHALELISANPVGNLL